MAGLTLLEASKLHSGDVVKSGVEEIFARENDVLRSMRFADISGNAVRFNREKTTAAVAFRAINGSYTAAQGTLDPQMEPLMIVGGDIDVDKAIVDMQGADQRSVQEGLKIKGLAHAVGHAVVKGDSATDPLSFDGLQKRCTGSQLIANGSTSGGDVLSLAKLDEAIDATDNPTGLYMSKAMRRYLSGAIRNTSVSGYIIWQKDEFGRPCMFYNDLPIYIVDRNTDVNATLGFNEANPGGGSSVGTSIYVVSFTDNGIMGIQNGGMNVRDLGELQEQPVYRTRIEWYVGLAAYGIRGATRLYGIKAGAVAA